MLLEEDDGGGAPPAGKGAPFVDALLSAGPAGIGIGSCASELYSHAEPGAGLMPALPRAEPGACMLVAGMVSGYGVLLVEMLGVGVERRLGAALVLTLLLPLLSALDAVGVRR